MENINERLLYFASCLDIKNVLFCIGHGADMNYADEGDTAFTLLAKASKYDHIPSNLVDEYASKVQDFTEEEKINAMKQLLKKGADINFFVCNDWNCTALYYAVFNREVQVVKFLLQHGANPNLNFFPEESPEVISSALNLAIDEKQFRPFLSGYGENDIESVKIRKEFNEIIDLLEKAGAKSNKEAESEK